MKFNYTINMYCMLLYHHNITIIPISKNLLKLKKKTPKLSMGKTNKQHALCKKATQTQAG